MNYVRKAVNWGFFSENVITIKEWIKMISFSQKKKTSASKKAKWRQTVY